MDILVYISLACIFMLAIVIMLLAKKQSRLQQALTDYQKQTDKLMDELKALYAGAAGQGNHIARLETQMSSLSDRQEQLDVKDPTSQSYSEAIEMIHRGASIEELLQHGLRREEAELLMRLHGEQSYG